MNSEDHVARNREEWDSWAADYVATGERNWAQDEPTWGIWDVPESELPLLPSELEGRDAIELGCGTALRLRLAGPARRPPGRDRQLGGAARHRPPPAGRARDRFPADPRQRRGGAAARTRASTSRSPSTGPASGATPIAGSRRPRACCVPAASSSSSSTRSSRCSARPTTGRAPVEERLQRPLFGLHRIEWPDDDSVEFHLPHGEMIALLRELRLRGRGADRGPAPEDSTTRYPCVTLEWARQWPCEEVWRAAQAGLTGRSMRCRYPDSVDVQPSTASTRRTATWWSATAATSVYERPDSSRFALDKRGVGSRVELPTRRSSDALDSMPATWPTVAGRARAPARRRTSPRIR